MSLWELTNIDTLSEDHASPQMRCPHGHLILVPIRTTCPPCPTPNTYVRTNMRKRTVHVYNALRMLTTQARLGANYEVNWKTREWTTTTLFMTT